MTGKGNQKAKASGAKNDNHNPCDAKEKSKLKSQQLHSSDMFDSGGLCVLPVVACQEGRAWAMDKIAIILLPAGAENLSLQTPLIFLLNYFRLNLIWGPKITSVLIT